MYLILCIKSYFYSKLIEYLHLQNLDFLFSVDTQRRIFRIRFELVSYKGRVSDNLKNEL